jgi:hypothetical protein
MADGTIDSQLGARICNGLGIMRQCLGRIRSPCCARHERPRRRRTADERDEVASSQG